jgi:hypothetical protein
MDKLESKKGDAQRKKDVIPTKGIVPLKVKSQAGEKIPIFENAQETYGLQDADPAKDRAFGIQPAEEGFPEEHQQTGRPKITAELSEGVEEKKSAPGSAAYQRTPAGSDQAKQDRRRKQKIEVISEGVKYHNGSGVLSKRRSMASLGDSMEFMRLVISLSIILNSASANSFGRKK